MRARTVLAGFQVLVLHRRVSIATPSTGPCPPSCSGPPAPRQTPARRRRQPTARRTRQGAHRQAPQTGLARPLAQPRRRDLPSWPQLVEAVPRVPVRRRPWAAQGTGDAAAAQAALGHSDLATTQRYRTATVDRGVGAATAVGAKLAPPEDDDPDPVGPTPNTKKRSPGGANRHSREPGSGKTQVEIVGETGARRQEASAASLEEPPRQPESTDGRTPRETPSPGTMGPVEMVGLDGCA